jgi:hypothetical protein
MFSQQHQQYQFACLYTKHKTQKRKVWNDGRLLLTTSNGINKAILYGASPKLGSFDPSIDECEISIIEKQSILQKCNGQIIETDKHIIEIDGPWAVPTTGAPTPSTTTTNTNNNNNGGSGGLLQGKRNLNHHHQHRHIMVTNNPKMMMMKRQEIRQTINHHKDRTE